MNKLFLCSALLLSLSLSVKALALNQLLLIGGGDHPPEVISHFVTAAGGHNARILVITWATDLPDKAMAQMKSEFEKVMAGVQTREAARRPLNFSSKVLFLNELRGATGVFFTGGDQVKIMSVIADSDIRNALIKFYLSGNIVGGTSAGTAIMSPVMFTGYKGDLARGLGLLPGTLLDTHFLARSRIRRLSPALYKAPNLTGIGIDQDNALWVTSGHHAQVFGPTHLTVIRTKPDGTQVVQSFKAGRELDF